MILISGRRPKHDGHANGVHIVANYIKKAVEENISWWLQITDFSAAVERKVT